LEDPPDSSNQLPQTAWEKVDTKEIATIEFFDSEASDSGVAIVRIAQGSVGLALSLSKDGDVEVFLSASDAGRLVEALREGIRRIGGSTAK
jgi:hypothetical protein